MGHRERRAGRAAWLETLAGGRAEGRLVVCDIVWAETRAAFPSAAAHGAFLERLGVHFDAADAAVANLAGEIHDRYRRATKDDGFFREQFGKLAVVRPAASP